MRLLQVFELGAFVGRPRQVGDDFSHLVGFDWFVELDDVFENVDRFELALSVM